MINPMHFSVALSLLVATGDTTDLTIPMVAAGVGVGVIAIALLARRRNKDGNASDDVPPTKGKRLR